MAKPEAELRFPYATADEILPDCDIPERGCRAPRISHCFGHIRLIVQNLAGLRLLGHRADCRIFLDKSVKDIIKEVLSKAGFTDFDDRTTGNYDQIDYCVQYRETDLNFISRLMEWFGIYYYFEHSDSKHMLILADAKSSHSPVPMYCAISSGPSCLNWTSERDTAESMRL